MTDQEAIQGLWRFVSRVRSGQTVLDSASHYEFQGDRVREVVPSLVNGGSVWSSFQLDPSCTPKRIVQTTEWIGPDNRPTRPPYITRGFYELAGESLKLCWGRHGEFPASFSDQTEVVVTLTREHGPPPQTKQPSGKAPLDVPGVGRLTWDDDVDWWQGEIIAQTGESASLHIEIEDETPERVAEAAQRFVAWLAAHEPAARQFAANRLLDLHNDTWNDGDEISAADFVSRMSLESAGWSGNGRANLYYRDGDLFWGHCISVTVDASGAFVNASIAG